MAASFNPVGWGILEWHSSCSKGYGKNWADERNLHRTDGKYTCKMIQVRSDQLFVCRHAFPTLSIDPSINRTTLRTETSLDTGHQFYTISYWFSFSPKAFPLQLVAMMLCWCLGGAACFHIQFAQDLLQAYVLEDIPGIKKAIVP